MKTNLSRVFAISSLIAPLAGATPPTISIGLTSTNTVAVVWSSPSTDFQLQQATNQFASGAWSNVTSGIQDNGFTKSLIVDPQTGTRFYRLYQPFVTSGSLISVTPGMVDLTLNSGQTTNITITIKNVGSNTLAGSASLSVTNPFTISGSGIFYQLGASQMTNFTLSYSQVAGGCVANSANLNFTGGGGEIVPLLGGLPKLYVECVGDSLTYGGSSSTTNFVPGGYRLKLYQLLTNAGINAVLVGTSTANSAPGLAYPEHDGFGGYEIGDIAASYQNYKAGLAHAPDWVLLQCGLNDFRHNHAITTATNRLESLIVQICTNYAGVKLAVADMNPWDNLVPTNNAMNVYYNPFIPGIVNREVGFGRKVYLADMRQTYITVLDVLPDDTHLNLSGCNKMATNFFNVMMAHAQ
jgi:lysophospholipase L1-like esterase